MNGKSFGNFVTIGLPLTYESDPEAARIIRGTNIFLTLYVSLLLLVGIPGNILTIIVLRRRHLKDNFMSIVLSWLAVSNLSVLLINSSHRLLLGGFEIEFWTLSIVSCIVMRALTFLSIAMSNWLLVIVTACRLFYVHRARRALAICTPLVIHLVLIVVMSLMLGVHVSGLVYGQSRTVTYINSTKIILCRLSKEREWRIARVFSFCYIPGLILIALNALILWSIRQPAGQTLNIKSVNRPRHHLSILVVLSDFLYIVCMLPFAIHYPMKDDLFQDTPKGHAKTYLVTNIVATLMHTSCAVNFFVYCYFGTRFRRELRHVVQPVISWLCPFMLSSSHGSNVTSYTFTVEGFREGVGEFAIQGHSLRPSRPKEIPSESSIPPLRFVQQSREEPEMSQTSRPSLHTEDVLSTTSSPVAES